MSAVWPRVALSEVLRSVPRPVHVKADALYREIGIRSHGKGVFHKNPVSGLELGSKRVFWIEPGDFVLNIVFAWEGAVAVLTDADAGMIGSHRFPTFRADEARLDCRFLLAYFRTPEGLDLLSRVSPGGAGRNRTLSRTAFLKQHIPLPPLSVQRYAVKRVEEIAAHLAHAQLLRKEAAEEAKALVHAKRNQRFHELRDRWPTAPLNSVVSSRLGKMLDQRFKTGLGSTPYLRNANVQWDRLDLRDVYEMDFTDNERAEFALQSGDILVCEGGDIGKAAIWNNEMPGCCYQKALHRLRCDGDRILPRFMLPHLLWAAHEGHWSELKTQTTIPHLTGVKLKTYPVILPSLVDQQRTTSELDELQGKVDQLSQLQAETSTEMNAFLPAVLAQAFAREL
jgi:type I restriction enzyme, S subunit